MKKSIRCTQCGGPMASRADAIEIAVGKYRVKDPSLMVSACKRCGRYELSQTELEESERRAAIVVLTDIDGPSGDVLRFARKSMGLRQVDLARALGTAPETVSRWEANEKLDRQVSLAVTALLRVYDEEPQTFDLIVKADPKPPTEMLVVRRRAAG